MCCYDYRVSSVISTGSFSCCCSFGCFLRCSTEHPWDIQVLTPMRGSIQRCNTIQKTKKTIRKIEFESILFLILLRLIVSHSNHSKARDRNTFTKCFINSRLPGKKFVLTRRAKSILNFVKLQVVFGLF